MLYRAKVIFRLRSDVLLCNTQLNKLDHSGQIFCPICSELANRWKFSSNNECNLYGQNLRDKNHVKNFCPHL